MSLTKPLHDEHQELLRHIEWLRAAAEAAAEGNRDTVVTTFDAALAFLRGHLIPHARAEDAVMYPKIEQLMQAPGATATMSRDHVEVVRLTQELQQLRDALSDPPTVEQRRSAQTRLYGLYAIIRLHFAKEEEIYAPVLDMKLTADDAADMFRAMQATGAPG